MERACILGTAGHIDHGKTALVRALTGVDCDRLPEEKLRGITIDLGFAELRLGEQSIGIVDVPGHERFIKNMLAGATGIDIAMLIVAADDGVMPQTREHFEILKLLNIKLGIIVITKCDLCDEERLEYVTLEIRELVRDSFLMKAPIIRTSARTGTGIDQLKQTLAEAATQVTVSTNDFPFRLHIDRVFTRPGHGTVVTGSIAAGRISVHDRPTLYRVDGSSETVALRDLHAHGRDVSELVAGQRGAINLAGIDHQTVARGDVLALGEPLSPGRLIAVRVTAAADVPRPLKNRLACRLHLGTADYEVQVSLLDLDRLQPGQTGLALLIGTAMIAVYGQAFILRDSGGQTTLGGGTVLLPNAPPIRRRHFDTILMLELLAHQDAAERARAYYYFHGIAEATTANLATAAGVPRSQHQAIREQALASGALTKLPNGRLATSLRVSEVETALLNVLSTLHAEFPLHTNHDRAQVIAKLNYVHDAEFVSLVVDRLIQSKKIVIERRRIALAEFKPKLSVNQRKLKDKIVEVYLQAELSPPELASFANLAQRRMNDVHEIVTVAVAEGLLVEIAPELYLHTECEAKARERLRARLSQGAATLAEIRDALGTTRKFAIPLCEYYDRLGVTIRDGDVRRWGG